jgi:hypothetical protein
MHPNVKIYMHFLSCLVSITTARVSEWKQLQDEYSILSGKVVDKTADMQDNLNMNHKMDYKDMFMITSG